LSEAVDAKLKDGLYPSLSAYVRRCESLPQFKATYVPWSAPQT